MKRQIISWGTAALIAGAIITNATGTASADIFTKVGSRPGGADGAVIYVYESREGVRMYTDVDWGPTYDTDRPYIPIQPTPPPAPTPTPPPTPAPAPPATGGGGGGGGGGFAGGGVDLPGGSFGGGGSDGGSGTVTVGDPDPVRPPTDAV
ncbi:hypothetical protein [Williamsia sp. CHRR-6]|uniref:hypothetical protein n=1 Tax=Williamsia sp. CHRR-6 TaxID=2835871 RepID=UPI001BD942F1|nr:hypothetical protein [Williamsia sp. CHRR-6]MBT0567504.1 hypothetical protein [Williamsia sp. CHRR-6]